eukprot:9615106-Karenia_brevis.AAC.1
MALHTIALHDMPFVRPKLIGDLLHGRLGCPLSVPMGGQLHFFRSGSESMSGEGKSGTEERRHPHPHEWSLL